MPVAEKTLTMKKTQKIKHRRNKSENKKHRTRTSQITNLPRMQRLQTIKDITRAKPCATCYVLGHVECYMYTKHEDKQRYLCKNDAPIPPPGPEQLNQLWQTRQQEFQQNLLKLSADGKQKNFKRSLLANYIKEEIINL
eukprot:gb/GEZN01017930.1/.p1 GENE.gb/GEZN01017930.1/~~gb/GEZN01017930.1/.p1  ORF type:complete len:139 (+),score=18.23 gb/GEZN01017930.1/:131-547(+)